MTTKPALGSTSISLTNLVYPLLAGAIIGITNFLIVLMYHNQAPLAVAVPLTRIVGIALAVVVGTLYFQEAMTLRKALGLCLTGVSIWLLIGKG